MPRHAAMLLAVFLIMNANAQDALGPDHGSRMLAQGRDLEAQERHADALALYASVDVNDSLYNDVLLRRLAMLSKLERQSEIPALCDKGLELDLEEAPILYMHKGLALRDMERYDEALSCYDTAIRKFPGNFQLHRLRAMLLFQMDDPARYLPAIQENAVRFPLQRDAHIALALTAIQEGRTSQAALAMFMAMIVRWGDEQSDQLLIWADDLLNGKLDADPKGVDIAPGDDFRELDLLLANKVAMNKKYKARPDLTYPFVKQGHFLLSSLKDHSTGNGFWSTYYVPFFQRLMADGHYPAFVYHCFASSRNQKIRAQATKYAKDVDRFRDGLLPLINTYFATFPDSVDGELVPCFHEWNGDGDLTAYGPGDISRNEHTAIWRLYHKNGALVAEGAFNAAHKKEGVWRHYHDNCVQRLHEEWKNGVSDGTLIAWHRNGVMSDSLQAVNDQVDGVHVVWDEHGRILSKRTFVAGKATGKAWYYHDCGALDHESQLVDNKIEGDLVRLYPNGSKFYEAHYVNGKRQGTGTQYHPNGRPMSTYTFVDGQLHGPFTEWYPNGTKKAEGQYTKDKLSGVRKRWYSNGTLESEEPYDEQGRTAGTIRNYTPEGTLLNELEWSRDQMVRYRYYDRSGNVLKEAKRSSGKFAFEGFFADGAKRMEGVYLDEGAKDGKWTWYWPDGTVAEEENLKQGKVDGIQTTYHENGRKKSEFRYLPGKGRTGPYSTYRTDGTMDHNGYIVDGELYGQRIRTLPDGTVLNREYYVNGKLHGWQTYYDPDGAPMHEYRMVDGVVHEIVDRDPDGSERARFRIRPGPYTLTRTFPNGMTAQSLRYMNGLLHGPSVWYYPNGSKLMEGNYLNGEEDGLWRSWHPNGKQAWEATYVMGTQHGTVRWWHVNGQLRSEETFEDGWSTGYKSWFSNGKPQQERERHFGMDHGTNRAYAITGDLQLVRYFRHGELVGYSYNGPDGKLVDTIPLTGGAYDLRPKYANGQVSREMHYRNGAIHGPYKEYAPNGRVIDERYFEAGDEQGEAREHHADGKPYSSGSWLNGQRHGEHVDHWDNGEPMDRCQWANGERHGTRTLYDRSGKPTLVLTYRYGEVTSMRKP